MQHDHIELGDLWAMLVAGWAEHLDASGANLVIDGIRNRADANGSYEGVTRMLWGIGGWLSRPERSVSVRWRDQEYGLDQLMRRAVLAGTDPEDPGYWGDPAQTGLAQPTVESGQVAYTLWQSRTRIWDHLSGPERQQIAAWLVACARRPERWHNNWALFWAVNHAARQSLGLPFDQQVIEEVMWTYLDGVYCGNGWYDDGPGRGTNHFDDYNLWVFASHAMAWIDVDEGRHRDRAGELLDRIRELMAHVPSFFAFDGAYPEYGRSGAYKFARLGAMLWAYRHGAWPHSTGLLSTIVERHLRWYVRRGAIRADGTLRQELTSTGSPAIRESYISTGAPYWAMQAFGGLWSLPDDDPFWSAEHEPLPIEKGGVHLVLPEPGWILTGTRESGQIHRFTTHVAHNPPKYAKHVYSTAAPYNAGLGDGLPVPDAMIGICVDGHVSHRSTNESASIHEDGWIRYRHHHKLEGCSATFDTIIVPEGDLHLRLHRITETSPGATVFVVEGAAALGFEHGDTPRLDTDPAVNISFGTTLEHAVGIRAWDEHRVARLPRSFADGGSGNVVHGCNVVPRIEGEMTSGDVAISTMFLGTARPASERDIASRLEDEPSLTWNQDGSVDIEWRGRHLAILA